ncbi:MAG: anaerobic glycerol-3-phosphate dehydrogenase subunit C [Pirellulaceae bacterium]
MDQERERIRADLRGIIRGEVRCDDLFLEMYSSDSSIFQIKPLAVVRPQRVSDIPLVVQYALENQIPVHARGAGTGLAGQSLGRGIVIDFAHKLQRILETKEDLVKVQPGVVLSQLNRHLAPLGRIFGPDPASRSVTTMGSVIALDASGSHRLQHGSARDHIQELQVVLANGELVDLREISLDEVSRLGSPELRRITEGVVDLLVSHRDKIEAHSPKSINRGSGYRLDDVIQGDRINLARLMAGSEGTLALVTQATLRTAEKSKARGVLLLFFEKLDSAAQAAVTLSGMDASACDLLDRRILAIARETDPRYSNLIPERTEAMLLVEVCGDDTVMVRDRLSLMADRIRRKRKLAFHSVITTAPREVGIYWELARKMAPILYRLKGASRPVPYIEDICVPPAALPAMLVKLQECLKRHEVIASVFAHAGHGQLHVRPMINLADREDLTRLEGLADSLYTEVLGLGGSISGEHGDGISRTPYSQRQLGSLYTLHERIKRLFDPLNIFNPGKKIVAPGPGSMEIVRKVVTPSHGSDNTLGDSQTAASYTGTRSNELPLLDWSPEEMLLATRNCNGCGRCRTTGADSRMCPLFRRDPSEEASPRSKANLLRGVLTGELPASELTSERMKEVVDLCFNCHQCRIECPSSVDIPKMVTEIKSQYVESNGLRFSDSVMAKIDRWAVWGSRFSGLANWGLGNRFVRWLMARSLGIAQGRQLPRFATRTFMRMAQRRRLTQPTRRSGRKVLYFVDLYANLFDADLGMALVSIMEHNGISVFVHADQQTSGMPAIANGAMAIARPMATRNVRLLADAVRQGYTIVATEPSAVMCLKHEYVQMLGTEDARLVAENTREACDYLWQLHQTGDLQLDLKPINLNVGLHVPCHLKALHRESIAQRLLELIPGISIRRIEKGCSGMAGTYGLQQAHFRTSLRIGWDLIMSMRSPQIDVGVTECSACKMQIEQGANKSVIHPLKLLARSYGLMFPQADSLTSPPHETLVS